MGAHWPHLSYSIAKRLNNPFEATTILTQGVKALKVETNKNPPPKEYDLREGHGFGIRVRKTGAITFFYMYHFEGKRKFQNLGIYGPPPDVSLSDARQKHAAAFSQVKAGLDPMTAPPVPDTVPQAERTVAQIAEEFLEKWSKVYYSPRWHYNCRLAIERDVLPELGEKEISTIRRRDIIALLERVVARAPGQARNVLKATQKLFWYAQDREYIGATPCNNMLDSLPALRVAEGRKRTMTDKEIITLWQRIDEGSGIDSVKRALKFILVTAQRPEEVVGMHRQEISQEADDIWWTIPPARIKTESSKLLRRSPQPHRVYLTPLAVSLIGDSTGCIFPSDAGDGPIRRNSLSQRVKRGITIIGDNEAVKAEYYGLPEWGPHDLRRTARTGMAALDIPSDWAEEVINHKKEKIKSIYDLHKYDKQKKEALTKWANHLESLLDKQ